MNELHFTLVRIRAIAPGSLEMTFADGQALRIDLRSIYAKHKQLPLTMAMAGRAGGARTGWRRRLRPTQAHGSRVRLYSSNFTPTPVASM